MMQSRPLTPLHGHIMLLSKQWAQTKFAYWNSGKTTCRIQIEHAASKPGSGFVHNPCLLMSGQQPLADVQFGG